MTSRLARLLVATLALAAVAASTGPAPAGAAPGAPGTPKAAPTAASIEHASEERILALMNDERRSRGMAAVQRHGGADLVAQFSANIQAWFNRLGHNPNLAKDVSERVTPGWHFVGENVGCGTDADHLHRMWMRSSGHARNVLNSDVDTMGVGTVYARGCLWATVIFVDA